MAGGKRYKFQGSEIAVLTSFDAQSPSQAITNITRANPAVVTSTAHGHSSGDVVKIFGVNGMTEVNDEVFVIEVVNANSFKLVDTDSTDYGAYTSGGHYDVGVFSNFCELTGYNRQGGSSAEIEATSLCSTAREYELGLPDFGTTQIDYHFAPRTTIQTAVQAFYLSGDKMAVKVTMPKSAGVLVQLGFIQQASEQVQVNGIWSGSMTVRNTGKRYDVAA